MSVYKYQSYLSITLETGVDLTSATATRILFVRPDGTKGSWGGTVVNNTQIRYELRAGDINQTGNWLFQAEATIDNRKALGRIANQVFQSNLQ